MFIEMQRQALMFQARGMIFTGQPNKITLIMTARTNHYSGPKSHYANKQWIISLCKNTDNELYIVIFFCVY